MATEFCYSLDEEQYQGKFGTPGDAAAQAEADIDSDCWNEFEERKYWVAEVCHPLDVIMHDKKALWAGETFVEQVEEWCADEIGADDRLIDLGKEDTAELGRLVFCFLRQRADFPYYGIANPVEHTHLAGLEDFTDEIACYVRAQLAEYVGGAT